MEDFVNHANKSNLHPLDIERWNIFIIDFFENKDKTSYEYIANYLSDNGFGKENISELIDRLQYGKDVLKTFTK